MSTVTLLRGKYGFKQGEIADWLGVSRSHVANYENDKRNFSQKASSKLTKLELVMAKMETNKSRGKKSKPIVRPERQAMVMKQLELHILTCNHEAIKLRWDLEAMQKKYEQVIYKMELLETLMADTDPKKSKVEEKWLDYHYAKAKKSLNSCDEVPQTKLKLKILMVVEGSKIKIDELD